MKLDGRDKAIGMTLAMYIVIILVQLVIFWISGSRPTMDGLIVSLALMILYKQYENEYDV